MSDSILPTVDDTCPRLDQGATFFRDYLWADNAGDPINLNNYEITACVLYTTGGMAFGPYTVENGSIELSASTGQFELRIPKSDTEQIKKKTRYVLVIDVERANTDDPETGYKVGEIARLIVGKITGYPKNAGE